MNILKKAVMKIVKNGNLFENKRLLSLEKSNYYMLIDSLVSRDINKDFNVNFNNPMDIFYTDIWTNMQYVLPHNKFEPVRNSEELCDVVVTMGIGFYEQQVDAMRLCQLNNIPLIICEDGFLRSATTFADRKADEKYYHGISFVFDNLSPYFDATRPSLLENMLNDKNLIINEEQVQTSRKLIDLIIEKKLSKYNHQPIYAPSIGKRNKKVLVVDQSYGDAAIIKGNANDKTFADMLNSAIRENPDADIIIKTHPDTNCGFRSGYFVNEKEHDNIYLMKEPINPISLIQYVDKIYVCTTQLGLEALMCGKEVHVFGMPFYAGWGLANERQTLKRRNNKRTLEEFFYITYILYSRYFNPDTRKPCEIEEAIEYLLKIRQEYFQKYNV
ncbi:MAG: capsule biosynthesis protein [Elusimicrobiota bacterium]|jgi:capsular polysaccharide export protein|nr:capsule biosynthesis protein [Elusimicrobiota bacterium]